MTQESANGGIPESGPIALDEVEAELARQFQAQHQGCQRPVMKAYLSNLIIFCQGADKARQLGENVPAIMSIHPARVLLVVAEEGPAETEMSASACLQGHETPNGAHVCTERITLRARGHAIERIPFAVRGLLIGDVPINVWWAVPQPPSSGGALIYELIERSQQVIYDSIGWPDPARGVAATASWFAKVNGSGPGGWRVVADLNWRRLKYWRRLLAQALDPATLPGGLDGITEVLVEHGPHAVVQGWELVSWLAARLGWQIQAGAVEPGKEISWRFRAGKRTVRVCIHRLDQGPSEIRHVRVAWDVDQRLGAVNFVVESENRLSALPEAAGASPRTLTVPDQPLAELVGRQLCDRERDRVFGQSMSVAGHLARSLLGH
jgi:glucose-6-phosphate dehydrogenase assembly protein OpcA